MTQPQPLNLAPYFDEMRDAVTKVVQQFIDNCPEGFDAADVAGAVVDVCSDELTDLYQARAELAMLRRLVAQHLHTAHTMPTATPALTTYALHAMHEADRLRAALEGAGIDVAPEEEPLILAMNEAQGLAPIVTDTPTV